MTLCHVLGLDGTKYYLLYYRLVSRCKLNIVKYSIGNRSLISSVHACAGMGTGGACRLVRPACVDTGSYSRVVHRPHTSSVTHDHESVSRQTPDNIVI